MGILSATASRLSLTLAGLFGLCPLGLMSCGEQPIESSSSYSYISIDGANGGLNTIVSGIQYDVDDTIKYLHRRETNSVDGTTAKTTLNGLSLVISEGTIYLGEHTFEGFQSGDRIHFSTTGISVNDVRRWDWPGELDEASPEPWQVDGRVIWPPQMPAGDDAELIAVNEGQEFRQRRRFNPDGTFHFDVPAGVDSIQLELNSRYLYLTGEVSVERPQPGMGPVEPQLSPVLGGYVAVTVSTPEGTAKDALILVKVQLHPPEDSTADELIGVPLGAGLYEFRAVPRGHPYTALVVCEPFVSSAQSDLRVDPGQEVLVQFDLQRK